MSNPITIEVSHKPPSGWDAFVEQHPDSRLYHLSSWNEMIWETFGHHPYYVVFRNPNQEIVGVLPITHFKSLFFGKFAVSLPFVNYGGPLLQQDDLMADVARFLADFRKQLDIEYVELRMHRPFETPLAVKTHKVTYLLPLPAEDEALWTSFKSKLRSQIRRPLKEHMFVRSGGVDLVDDFYYVFSHNMRDLGTPVYSKSFFQNILNRFPENAFIVVVYSDEDIPVAASFLIQYKSVMEIPWASSLKAYNRFSPNMLLYWESLKLAIHKGCKVFDFGRCTPGSGTCRFKKQWGAEEKQLYWYYALPEGESLPEISPRNPRYEMMVRVWQKMPLIFTNTVGPYIIRNIPA
ncbi:MAG: FemAB family PEP-CTERM system-associated protein [Calditrichaeota bacterium]|nr:FemAB family PEP-CTERM system-associated protein [Calditrichota bacterium]